MSAAWWQPQETFWKTRGPSRPNSPKEMEAPSELLPAGSAATSSNLGSPLSLFLSAPIYVIIKRFGYQFRKRSGEYKFLIYFVILASSFAPFLFSSSIICLVFKPMFTGEFVTRGKHLSRPLSLIFVKNTCLCSTSVHSDHGGLGKNCKDSFKLWCFVVGAVDCAIGL